MTSVYHKHIRLSEWTIAEATLACKLKSFALGGTFTIDWHGWKQVILILRLGPFRFKGQIICTK